MIFYHDWTGGTPKSHDLILFPLAKWYTPIFSHSPGSSSWSCSFCPDSFLFLSESIDGEKWQAWPVQVTRKLGKLNSIILQRFLERTITPKSRPQTWVLQCSAVQVEMGQMSE